MLVFYKPEYFTGPVAAGWFTPLPFVTLSEWQSCVFVASPVFPTHFFCISLNRFRLQALNVTF